MRLFVAVWPPPVVVEALAAIDRPPRPGIRWTTRDQWHVTLRFLGPVATEDLELVKASLRPLTADPRLRAVVATVGPTGQRLGNSVWCLPVAGLDELAGTVMAHTAGIGAGPEDRPFRGHLTVARAGRGADPRPPAPVAVAASWNVDEVTLVASDLHPTGARYRVLDRYPLRS